MPIQNILHIDSSPNLTGSSTRAIGRSIVEALQAQNPEAKVVYRDLIHDPMPFVTDAWLRGAFGGDDEDAQEAIALSNALVDELLAADVIVIGSPMHNFGISAPLKAYIDQIVRGGRTFRFEEGRPKGLVRNVPVFVAISRRGDYGPGSPVESWNTQEPYLKVVFGFIGVTDLRFVTHKLSSDPDEAREALEKAKAKGAELALV